MEEQISLCIDFTYNTPCFQDNQASVAASLPEEIRCINLYTYLYASFWLASSVLTLFCVTRCRISPSFLLRTACPSLAVPLLCHRCAAAKITKVVCRPSKRIYPSPPPPKRLNITYLGTLRHLDTHHPPARRQSDIVLPLKARDWS